MRKNVWNMTEKEIAIINGKRYRYNRDFKKRMLGVGIRLNRELVNISDSKDTLKFLIGIEVEIE